MQETELRDDDVMARLSSDELRRIIRARVRRQVRRLGEYSQETEDIAQEVFLNLWRDKMQIFRRWDHSRGLSLLNFVGLVAEREAGKAIIRLRRHRGLTATTCMQDEVTGDYATPETVMASREQLEQLNSYLSQKLTQVGLHLFLVLLVEEVSVDSACSETGLSRAAVYTWRCRLRTLIRTVSHVAEVDACACRQLA